MQEVSIIIQQNLIILHTKKYKIMEGIDEKGVYREVN